MKFYRTWSHSKYDLKVHIIFLPKYRKRILHWKYAEIVRDEIRKICIENEVVIITWKMAFDHIHLFVSYPPYLSISDIVKRIKWKSAHKVLGIPELRKVFWWKSFWSRWYLAVSSWSITDEMIQHYIDDQEGEDLWWEIEIQQ